jgi:hypothetical protein
VVLSDCWRTEESNCKSVPPTNCKEGPDSALRDRFGRGSAIPISIKYKKLGNEEAISRQREHQRKDRYQLELGKATREPPPVEIGPKRLKVRGPSYVGTESRFELKFRSLE